MPADPPHSDPSQATFDPFRHRREIELMEERFRERAERSGGGPVTTGAIDEKVQAEMRQFFSESAKRLETVVPAIQDGSSAAGPANTGEIQAKIDALFSDAEAGIAAQAPAPRRRFTGGAHGPSRSTARRAAAPYTPPVQPAASRPAVPPLASGTGRAVPPGRAAPRGFTPTADASGSRPKMDLKTALERLRKHGIVKDDSPPPRARPAAPAAPSTPAGPAEPEAVAPAVTPPAAPPAAESAPPPRPVLRRSAADEMRAAAAAAANEPARPAPPPVRREPPPSAAPSPAAAAPDALTDPAMSDSFDAIFAEVEGLVLGTLEDSVAETFDAARTAEPAMRKARATPEVDADEFQVTEGPSTSAPARPLSSMLPRPEEDEPDEPVPEAAPDGAYDWGVQPAARPAGAWLLEDGAEEAARRAVQGSIQGTSPGAAAPKAPTPTLHDELAPPGPPPEPAPATEAVGAAGGADARTFLLQKLKGEIARLGPALRPLKEQGRLSPGILGAMDPLDDDEDDDDELCVGSFDDDRPRGDDAVLTPMKIIEEIRNVRRLQDEAEAEGLLG